MSDPVVKIEEGLVEGFVEKDLIKGKTFYSFEGIPYGEPPVGKLRFKPPRPIKPWNGTLKAKSKVNKGNFTSDLDVVQGKNGFELKTVIMGSEDCLNLNVYTKEYRKNETKSLMPVMVFIHGGAFSIGKTEDYGPHFLLSEDVVLVTIHYRLGALGFLVLNDPSLNVTGNAGLKDQVLALKWVQRNIQHFNGDKNNVTIFGESAGASSVDYLLLSPTAKGLFHKAIMQSGTSLNFWAESKRKNEGGKNLARALGCTSSDDSEILNFLQALSVEKLHEGQIALKEVLSPAEWRELCPVVEDPASPEPFITEEPITLLRAGKFAQVPVITGFNDLEGIALPFMPSFPEMIWKHVEDGQMCPRELGLSPQSAEFQAVEEKIKRFYFQEKEPSGMIYEGWLYATDSAFLRQIIQQAKLLAKHSAAPVFMYRLSAITKLPLQHKMLQMDVPGVSHYDDISYLFSTRMTMDVEPGSDEDKVRNYFVSMWTSFAKHGVPESCEMWKPTNGEELNVLDIGLSLKYGPLKDEERRMKFWDEILSG